MSNFHQIRLNATPIEIQLRWSDQDVNGHVNNVHILMLMEEARIRATKHWNDTTRGQMGRHRVARALNTSFDREVHYGKATTVWVWIARVGTTSFVFGQLLTQEDQLCVYSEATMVVLDSETGRPTPHDAAFRHQLKAHAGPAYSSRDQ